MQQLRRRARDVGRLTLKASRLARSAVAFPIMWSLPADARAPLNYLTSHGLKADQVLPLTWGLMAVSIIIVIVITVLLIWSVWWRPGIAAPAPGTKIAIERPQGGVNWVWIGVGVSSAILLASIVWTVAVLARTTNPPAAPAVLIEITARQWWWQARYQSDDPSRVFATANEIHIPAGQPVLLRLAGSDVIHSFWVPALSGKTDVIPGQTNEIWLQANEPGVYRGQCAEYCGLEHARMAFLVVAQTPADFQRWWQSQIESEPQPTGIAKLGLEDFNVHCGGCHLVRGTDANGIFGPDLSHLMQRRTLAAGMLPNNNVNLLSWIRDPQAIKPGVKMQRPELSEAELGHIDAYLQTLR